MRVLCQVLAFNLVRYGFFKLALFARLFVGGGLQAFELVAAHTLLARGFKYFRRSLGYFQFQLEFLCPRLVARRPRAQYLHFYVPLRRFVFLNFAV